MDIRSASLLFHFTPSSTKPALTCCPRFRQMVPLSSCLADLGSYSPVGDGKLPQVEMAPTPCVNRAAASFLVHGRIGKYVNMLQCLWEILQCQRANHQADVKPSNSVSIFIPVCCVEYNGSSEIPEQQVNKSKSKI